MPDPVPSPDDSSPNQPPRVVPPVSTPAAKPKPNTKQALLGCGLLIVLVFVVIGIIGAIFGDHQHGGDGSSPTADAPAAPLPHIEASDLVAAYVANELAADAKFKGNSYIISGTVDDIGKDIMGTAYVTLDMASNGSCYECAGTGRSSPVCSGLLASRWRSTLGQ